MNTDTESDTDTDTNTNTDVDKDTVTEMDNGTRNKIGIAIVRKAIVAIAS